MIFGSRFFSLALSGLTAYAQLLFGQKAATQIPEPRVSSCIDADGIAFISRVVEPSQTLTDAAQNSLAAQHLPPPKQAGARPLWQMSSDTTRTLYPGNVELSNLAGVAVSVATPPAIPAGKTNRELINLHCGGFISDSASLTESIPSAVIYRLAPEYTFPAQVEDVVTSYKQLLTAYAARNIGIYASSAAAVSPSEALAR